MRLALDIDAVELWLHDAAHDTQTPDAHSDNNSSRKPGHNEALDWLARQLRWELILAELGARRPDE